MFGKLFTRLFGSRNDRYLKKLQKTVDQINSMEGQFAALSDDQLKEKTAEFKEAKKLSPEEITVPRNFSIRLG